MLFPQPLQHRRRREHHGRRVGTLDCGRFRRPHGIDLGAKGWVYAVSEGASRLLVALYHDRGLAVIDPAKPGEQHYAALPDKPVSVSFHGESGEVLLSTLADEVCVVPLGLGKLDRRIATRGGPDPTAVVPPTED